MTASDRVAVLGAGLAGACVALELARHGVGVDVYERDPHCLTRASAHNEGKIHLGYVYAADRTLRSARTMAAGARAFAPLLRRWIGGAVDRVPVSCPFDYVVHAESQLDLAAVDAHLRASHAVALELWGDAPADYFGSDPRAAPRRMDDAEVRGRYDPRTAAASFATAEIAVDPEALAEAVRARLRDEPRIRCITGARVTAVDPRGGDVEVRFARGADAGRARYRQAVNALGENRLAIDATAGIVSGRACMYRLKHFVRLHVPAPDERVRSATVVLGPFGDVAAYRNGAVYLSWYPAGRTAASNALQPPAWPLELDREPAHAMAEAIRTGLGGVVPAVASLRAGGVERSGVKAGIIVAWGASDIDDPRSELHERHALGAHTYGRYHSLDPGKLTTAPYFADVAASRVRQAL